MTTSLQDLIQWTLENAFNIEGQCGTKYIAIDHEEMRLKFDKWLEKERGQIYDAFVAGSDRGKGNVPFNCEQYYSQNYIAAPEPQLPLGEGKKSVCEQHQYEYFGFPIASKRCKVCGYEKM